MKVSAKKVLSEFKKFSNPPIIKEQGLSFSRFTYKAAIEITIDYYRKNDLGSELLAIKIIDQNLQQLLNAKKKLEDFCIDLCSRITYLTESLRLIETDDKNNKAQIRSYPPYVQQNEKIFFELLINPSESSLLFTRKSSDPATHQVKPVSFILPDNVLERILKDMLENSP